jgi:hypothetical protein
VKEFWLRMVSQKAAPRESDEARTFGGGAHKDDFILLEEGERGRKFIAKKPGLSKEMMSEKGPKMSVECTCRAVLFPGTSSSLPVSPTGRKMASAFARAL